MGSTNSRSALSSSSRKNDGKARLQSRPGSAKAAEQQRARFDAGSHARQGASTSMKLPRERYLRGGSFLHKTEQTVVDRGFSERGYSSLSQREPALAGEDVCVQELIPEFALRVVLLAQLNKLRPTTRRRTTTILAALPEFCDRNYLDELSRRFKASRAGRNCGSAARARRKA